MEETFDSAEESPVDVCQECGSRDVQHRSYSHIHDEQDGKLLLLCEDCHRERFAP